MTKEKMRETAVQVLEGIHNDIRRSVLRAAGIMGDASQGMTEIIMPEINEALKDTQKGGSGFTYIPSKDVQAAYTGPKDLGLYMDRPWNQVIEIIYSACKKDQADREIRVGDYITMPLDVPEASFDGVDFESLKLEAVKMVAVDVFENKVMFQADEVLFNSAMNRENRNNGGFQATALAKYLNETFLETLGSISDYLKENKDGLKITLPTYREVFGEGDPEYNWDEPVRMSYFAKRKNRIKVDADDDTCWWWLSTASGATHFCSVHGNGSAYYSIAGLVNGVSPAFCVA